MRIPLSWLHEFVATPHDSAGLTAFCDTLTMAGLEVEEVLDTTIGPTLYTKITPNRGDWSSVYGTAREAATALNLPVKTLVAVQSQPVASVQAQGQSASVLLEEPASCPRYSATVIKGVKVGPAPQWMQERLSAALGDSYRPINNIADITNYVMLELGQPLHAFDLDTLKGGEIRVRYAREGETLITLDGAERKLDSSMLCICDRERPIALAGIMGGQPTEISDQTVNVLLEAAHFERYGIRRTAKKTLASQASYRFERYVDPDLVPLAAARAAQLIVECAGGEVVETVDAYPHPASPVRVLARMERIRKLLGADVDRDTAIAALERLGVSVERSSGALDCVIPSWRPDLTIEDDIAEEVGRIALGYANLPETAPPVLDAKGGDSPQGKFLFHVKQVFIRLGMQEVQTHSLVGPDPIKGVAQNWHETEPVALRSPRAPEYSRLRDSLIPNHIAIAARALRENIRDFALFEIGPVYERNPSGVGYREPLRLTGLCAGSALPPAWGVKGEAYAHDFFFVKGAVETLLTRLGVVDTTWTADTHRLTHPGRTATVRLNGELLGVVAELSETVVTSNDLPRRTYLFDLDGDALMRLAGDSTFRYAPLPRYPAATRDLAPVFDVSVPFSVIEEAATRAAGKHLESFRLTDVFTGAALGENRRSLTLRLVFRSQIGTLKDAEVEVAISNVRAALEEIGGEFRA